ncbi:MAG: hypothetical protein KatS3mg105_3524 [Gemmatales bacterium]|nr:MAG: hypothetical protein KatS3mg105_3524 [Gemmatales bacterium]
MRLGGSRRAARNWPALCNSWKNRIGRRIKTANRLRIIGSGPAGLAAAHDLALLGFKPRVYEMEPVPAGMLAVGIPQYRLPRDLIQAEVEFIRSLGVEFICNTQVGKDITLAEIRQQHRATIIAIGLKKSRSLPIPGANGQGVLGRRRIPARCLPWVGPSISRGTSL